MKRIFFLIVFLLFPLQLLALEVTFLPSAKVTDKTIRLGDIVKFDEKTDLSKALASQIVGQSPPPGENIQLNGRRIKQYLVSSRSLDNSIIWKGSPVTRVQRLGLEIDADRIGNIIKDYIQRNEANLPSAAIRFIPKSLPIPFTLPIGQLDYEVIPSHPGIINSSRFSIIFKVDNKVVKNMSVRGEVEALAKVVVSSKPLKKGEIITPASINMSVVDISNISNPGFDLHAFIGKRLKKSLRPGSPVLTTQVESLPVVRRGEHVKIVIQSGALLLTATGLSYNDGHVNQLIRVQNISSKKILFCRVAAPGLVEVML